jgi:hypothetical protein
MSSTGDFNDFTARLRGFIRAAKSEPPRVGSYKDGFNSLALDLFGLQFEHNAPYRRFCESRGAMAGAVEHWSQIPAIPTSAFKELELSCLPAEGRAVVFHSSGTTGQRPSRHFHNADSLAIYEASLVVWFRANFQRPFPLTPALSPEERENHSAVGFETGERLIILTPRPAEAPHSSLVHMFETLRREFGSADSVFLGRSDEDGSWLLDVDAALEALSKTCAANQPVLLLGTAFSYVHLLDELARRGRRFELPSGSRAMETGGYKGRSRCLERSELHSLITHHLGIPSRNIVCEYGMSELSSQAYAGTLPGSRITHHTTRFRFPPWCKVQIISPETGREVGEGATGLIRLFDLANAYSVMAIQTEDLGIRRGDGFELLGRAVLAEPRGCSLMANA